MTSINGKIFPNLPQALVARIVSYKVENTSDVANLRLVCRSFGSMIHAAIRQTSSGGHHVRCPNRRIGDDSFIRHLLDYDSDGMWYEYGFFVGDVFSGRSAPFLGADVKTMRFLSVPENLDVPKNLVGQPPAFSSSDIGMEELRHICISLDHAESIGDVQRLYAEAEKKGMLEPIQRGDPVAGNPETVTTAFPVLLTVSVPSDAPCCKKRSIDGEDWLEIVSTSDSYKESDSWKEMVPPESGSIYRAVVVSQETSADNQEVYVVQVLMRLVTFSYERDLANYFLDPPIVSLPTAAIWNSFQKNKSLVEGIVIVDDLLGRHLHDSLNGQVNSLATRQENLNAVDYHPNSNDVVRDLVHPALYSYVKDTSPLRGLVSDVPPCIFSPEGPNQMEHMDEVDEVGFDSHQDDILVDDVDRQHDFWGRAYESSQYQWLPTYFSISPNGSCIIEDYINNLVPGGDPAHAPLYDSLARLFEHCLPFIESVYSYVRTVRPQLRDHDEDMDYSDHPLKPFDVQYCCLRGQRLQVITKIVDYELATGQSYSGVWHVEGMSHEEIVLTALYVLDRDSDLEGADIEFKRTFLRDEASLIYSMIDQVRAPSVEEIIVKDGLMPLGTVSTPKGRLVVFPNSHVHKVSDMMNIGIGAATTAVAKRRIVVFFVVNPLRRIVSTREVAPQQKSCGGAMPHDEALAHRLQLMDVRKHAKQDWNVREIELCEH
jgi:hypothetical protein